MGGEELKAGLERPPPEMGEFQRRATDLFNRAISEREADQFLELADPAIDFQSITSAAEGITYQGHDGLRRYFERISEPFEEIRLDIEEMWMAAPQVLISLGRWYARGSRARGGRDTGVEQPHARLGAAARNLPGWKKTCLGGKKLVTGPSLPRGT